MGDGAVQDPGTSSGRYEDAGNEAGAGFSGRDDYLDVEVDEDDGGFAVQNEAGEGRAWRQGEQERSYGGRGGARPGAGSSPDRWSPVGDTTMQDDWD